MQYVTSVVFDTSKCCVLLPVFDKWHGVPLLMSFSGVNHITDTFGQCSILCEKTDKNWCVRCALSTKGD